MVLLYPVQTKALHLQHGGSAAVDSTPDMDSSLLQPKHVAVEVDRIEPPAMTLSRSLVLLVTGALCCGFVLVLRWCGLCSRWSDGIQGVCLPIVASGA